MYRLKTVLNQGSLFKKVWAHHESEKKLVENWEEILGKLALEVRFGFIKEGVLHVEVNNPMWVTEIDYYKKHILDKVNSILGKKIIKELKIKKELKKSKEIPVQKVEKSNEDLETLIRKDIESKRKKGWILCSKCEKVYTNKGLCTFCSLMGI